MTTKTELQRYTELDAKLVEAARNIKVLSSLGWPARHYDEFMQGWLSGNPTLPTVEYQTFDLHGPRTALQRLAQQAAAAKDQDAHH